MVVDKSFMSLDHCRDNIEVYQNRLFVTMGFFLPLYYEAYSFIALLLTIMFFFNKNFKEKLKKISDNKALLVLLGLFLIHVIWEVVYQDTARWAQYIKDSQLLLLPIIIYSFLRFEYLRKFFLAFIFGMIVSETYAYGIFFEILEPTATGTKSNPSPFMNYIPYSIYLAFSSIIIFKKILGRKESGFFLIILTIYLLASVANLFIINGRTGQVLFLTSLFILFLSTYKNKIQAITIAFFLMIIISFVSFQFSETFQKRVIHASDDIKLVLEERNFLSSLGNRIGDYYIFPFFLEKAPLYGILGVGEKESIQIIKEIEKEQGIQKLYSFFHSAFFGFYAKYGIIGFIAFLYLLFLLLKYQQKNKELNFLKYIVVASIIIQSLSTDLLSVKSTSYLLMTLVALLMVKVSEEQANKEVFGGRIIKFDSGSLTVFVKYSLFITFMGLLSFINDYHNMKVLIEVLL